MENNISKPKALGISLLWTLFYFGVRIIIAFAVVMSNGGTIDGYKSLFESIPSAKADMILLVCSVVTPVFILFTVKAGGRRFSDTLGFHVTSLSGIAVAVLFATVLTPVLAFIVEKISFPDFITSIYDRLSFLSIFGEASQNLILSVFLIPLCEEIVFRGAIFTTLNNSCPFPVAAFLSTLLYALSFPSEQKALSAFLMGLVLCILYVRFGSLWAVLFSRLAFGLIGRFFDINVFPKSAQYAVIVLCAAAVISVAIWMISTAVREEDNEEEE